MFYASKQMYHTSTSEIIHSKLMGLLLHSTPLEDLNMRLLSALAGICLNIYFGRISRSLNNLFRVTTAAAVVFAIIVIRV